LDEEWFVGLLVLLHESDGTVRHAKDIGRVRIAVFMSVLVADVPIAVIVAIRSRAAAVDMPLAVVSRRVASGLK